MIGLILMMSLLLNHPEAQMESFTTQALAPRGVAFLKIIAKPRLVPLAVATLLIKRYVIDPFWGTRLIQFWEDVAHLSFHNGDFVTLCGMVLSVSAYYVAYHLLYKFAYGKTPYTRLAYMQMKAQPKVFWHAEAKHYVFGLNQESFLFRLGGLPAPQPTLMFDGKRWTAFELPKKAA